jgi:archaellum component FlaC
MPVLTDQLAEEIKGLTTSVNGLRTDFAGFKASTETQLKTIVGIGRWVAASFAGGVLTIAVGAAGVIWAASALHSKVEQQGVRLDKVEQRLDKVDQQLGQVNQQLGQIIQRLDQVAPKTKP